MAIQPIAQFRRNETGLEAILARGTSAISGILSASAQVGRDMANLQTKQTTSFLTERQRVISQNQRKREENRRIVEGDREFEEEKYQFRTKFGRNVEESDREFGLRQDSEIFDRSVKEAALEQSMEAARLRGEKFKFDQEVAGEELEFQRQDRAERSKVNNVRLQEAELKLADAKSQPERAAAQQEVLKERGAAQAEFRGRLDGLLRDKKFQEAQSLLNTDAISLGFDKDTLDRFQEQVKVDEPAPPKTATKPTAKPVTEMSPEEAAEELALLREASDIQEGRKVPADLARRMAELRRKAEPVQGEAGATFKGLLDRGNQ